MPPTFQVPRAAGAPVAATSRAATQAAVETKSSVALARALGQAQRVATGQAASKVPAKPKSLAPGGFVFAPPDQQSAQPVRLTPPGAAAAPSATTQPAVADTAGKGSRPPGPGRMNLQQIAQQAKDRLAAGRVGKAAQGSATPAVISKRAALPVLKKQERVIDEPIEEVEEVVVYLDEVPMLCRPAVPPAPTDREVFLDPWPDASDSELAEWCRERYGEFDSALKLPGKNRGYILFSKPESAARCVASAAGVWSESERAVSGQWSMRKKGVQCAYPDSLVSSFIGEGASVLKEIKERVGMKEFNVYGGSVVPPGEKASETCRVHFIGKGMSEQLEMFQAEIEKRFINVHESLAAKFDKFRLCEVLARGIPNSWSLDEVKALFEPQGEVEKITGVEGSGRACILFSDPFVARQAASRIDATDLGHEDGILMRCALSWPWNTKDDVPMADSNPGKLHAGMEAVEPSDSTALFVGNLALDVTEEDLKDIFVKFGVISVRLPTDSATGKIKGHAFVELEDPEDNPKAIQEVNGLEHGGRILRVRSAASNPGGQPTAPVAKSEPVSVFTGGLAPDCDEEQLKEFLGLGGDLLSLRLVRDRSAQPPNNCRGYGFAEYVDMPNAQQAIDNLHNTDFMGNPIILSLAEPPEPLPPGGKKRSKAAAEPPKPPAPTRSQYAGVRLEGRTKGIQPGYGDSRAGPSGPRGMPGPCGRPAPHGLQHPGVPGIPPHTFPPHMPHGKGMPAGGKGMLPGGVSCGGVPHGGMPHGAMPPGSVPPRPLPAGRRMPTQPPPPSMPPPSAPGVWEKLQDPRSGSYYFWDHASSTSSWQEPQTAAGFWERILDEQKNAYYYWNETTNESCWDLPSPQAPLPAASIKPPFAVPRGSTDYHAPPGRPKLRRHGTVYSICLSLSADHSAHVGLFPNKMRDGIVDSFGDFYQFAFGCYNNRHCSIARSRAGRHLVGVDAAVLDPATFVDLWLAVDTSTGRVSCGTGLDVGQGQLMEFIDNHVFSPHDFAFMAGENAVLVVQWPERSRSDSSRPSSARPTSARASDTTAQSARPSRSNHARPNLNRNNFDGRDTLSRTKPSSGADASGYDLLHGIDDEVLEKHSSDLGYEGMEGMEQSKPEEEGHQQEADADADEWEDAKAEEEEEDGAYPQEYPPAHDRSASGSYGRHSPTVSQSVKRRRVH